LIADDNVVIPGQPAGLNPESRATTSGFPDAQLRI
jgi:hypothetical protein